jgi:hypothetical protein
MVEALHADPAAFAVMRGLFYYAVAHWAHYVLSHRSGVSGERTKDGTGS